jgi:hypothetical protein
MYLLARAAANTDIRSDKVLWEIRETIMHFSQITRHLCLATFHIARYPNGIVHSSGHQALPTTALDLVFRRNNSAHISNHYSFSNDFYPTILSGYVQHSVHSRKLQAWNQESSLAFLYVPLELKFWSRHLCQGSLAMLKQTEKINLWFKERTNKAVMNSTSQTRTT